MISVTPYYTVTTVNSIVMQSILLSTISVCIVCLAIQSIQFILQIQFIVLAIALSCNFLQSSASARYNLPKLEIQYELNAQSFQRVVKRPDEDRRLHWSQVAYRVSAPVKSPDICFDSLDFE